MQNRFAIVTIVPFPSCTIKIDFLKYQYSIKGDTSPFTKITLSSSENYQLLKSNFCTFELVSFAALTIEISCGSEGWEVQDQGTGKISLLVHRWPPSHCFLSWYKKTGSSHEYLQ
jgi:hypothetical protein